MQSESNKFIININNGSFACSSTITIKKPIQTKSSYTIRGDVMFSNPLEKLNVILHVSQSGDRNLKRWSNVLSLANGK